MSNLSKLAMLHPRRAGKTTEALTLALQAVEVMGAALHQLAAFDDQRASAHLAETGSYAAFDSPDSVKVAREALAKMAELVS